MKSVHRRQGPLAVGGQEGERHSSLQGPWGPEGELHGSDHGEPGIDEVSVFGRTTVYEVKDGSADKYTIEPSDLGLRLHDLRDVVVSSPVESIEKARRGLMGVDKAALDFIAANTAMALYVAGKVKDPRDGVEAVMQVTDNPDGFWAYVNEVAAVSRGGSA